MKKIVIFLVGLMIILSLTACNATTKALGGTMTVELESGKKLINCTWKDDEFWYLVRDIREDEKPEIYEFIEKSNSGIFEGKVIIKESK